MDSMRESDEVVNEILASTKTVVFTDMRSVFPPNTIASNLMGVPPMGSPYRPIRPYALTLGYPDFNAMAARVHEANAKWWISLETGERVQRNPYELLCLMASEVSEALEGERKNLKDDKLDHRMMAEVEVADVFIRTLDFAGGHGIVLTDLADPVEINLKNRAESLWNFHMLLCRIGLNVNQFPDEPQQWAGNVSAILTSCFAYCDAFGYDLMGAYEEKMAFNAVRPDHTIEARKDEGGKQF